MKFKNIIPFICALFLSSCATLGSSSSSLDNKSSNPSNDEIDNLLINREYADIDEFKRNQGLKTETKVLFSNVPGEEKAVDSEEDLQDILEDGFELPSSGPNGYYTKYEKKSLSTKTSDIVSWGVDDAFFYPGNILLIKNIEGDQYYESLPGVVPAPTTLSISTYTSTGTKDEGSVFKTIEKPTLASTRSAISELVKANLVEGAQLPFQFASSISEINSSSQMKMTLNMSENSTTNSALAAFLNAFAGSIKADARTNISETESSVIGKADDHKNILTAYLIELSQVFYTIDIDLPSSPSELISPSSNKTAMENALNKGGVPVYVASISFGRKALIAVTSNLTTKEFAKEILKKDSIENTVLSSEDINTLLKTLSAGERIALDKDGDHYNVAKENSSTSDYYIESSCFIYGGSYNQGEAAAQASNASEILRAFTSTSSPTELIGKPLSYTLRFMDGSNAIANIGSSSSYVQKKLIPIEVNHVYVDEDNYRSIEMGGDPLELEGSRDPENATRYPIIFKLDGVEGFDVTPSSVLLNDGVNIETSIDGLASIRYINGKYRLYVNSVTSQNKKYIDKNLRIVASSGNKSLSFNTKIKLPVGVDVPPDEEIIEPEIPENTKKYQVTLIKNDGSDASSITSVYENGVFVNGELDAPIRRGYIFTGYYDKAEQNNAEQIIDDNMQFKNDISDNLTLYAHWVRNSSSIIVVCDRDSDAEIRSYNISHPSDIWSYNWDGTDMSGDSWGGISVAFNHDYNENELHELQLCGYDHFDFTLTVDMKLLEDGYQWISFRYLEGNTFKGDYAVVKMDLINDNDKDKSINKLWLTRYIHVSVDFDDALTPNRNYQIICGTTGGGKNWWRRGETFGVFSPVKGEFVHYVDNSVTAQFVSLAR